MNEPQHLRFSVEYRSDGIIVYHVRSFEEEVVDLLIERAAEEDQKAYAEGKVILSLTDLSYAVYPTVYFFKKIVQAAQQTPPDLNERMAFVIHDKLLMWRVAAYFINQLPNWSKQKFKIFYKREEAEAIQWLLANSD